MGDSFGGYPWTVIRVEHRNAYMAALEEASVRHDIRPFTDFVATEMVASAAFTKSTPSRPDADLEERR